MRCMNEREEFLRHFTSVFMKMVERLDTMTESQVLNGLLEVEAARRIWKEEFAERIGALIQADDVERPRAALPARDTREEFAYLSSMHAIFNSANKLNELRLRVGAKTQPLGTMPFGALQDALNERLESLRRGPSGDA
jgi:hypothetical protein